MAQFEELQAIWQSQAPPGAPPADSGTLARALARSSRKQTWIYGGKLVAVITMLSIVAVKARGSVWSLGGVALVAAAALVMLALDWRHQRAIANLNFTEPSAGFVRSAIRQLREQREPFHGFLWPFMICLVVGVNLMYLDRLRAMALGWRVGWHVVGSALPFGGYRLGVWARHKRWESHARPLVARLEAMLGALEDDSR